MKRFRFIQALKVVKGSVSNVIQKVKEVLRIKQMVYNLLFEFASDETLAAVDVLSTACRYFEKNVVFIIDENNSILNVVKVLKSSKFAYEKKKQFRFGKHMVNAAKFILNVACFVNAAT
ncbi:hypothetical protein Tco_0586952 [Tanacetum coccineum]